MCNNGHFVCVNLYVYVCFLCVEDTMLRIEMEDWSGKKYYAVYNYFRVDGLKHNYRLHVSGYHGNAGDSMTSLWENHDGMPFSTKDKDNDGRFVSFP